MVEPSRTAVVMIDMQNGFIDRRSPLCIEHAAQTIPACARVLETARTNGMTVVHAIRSYAADGSNVEPCRYSIWKHGKPLSSECDASINADEPQELAPTACDIVVTKPSFSAFFQTELDDMLRKRGIDTVVLLGTTTPNCIRSSCYDALALGYNVAVVEDATSSRTEAVQIANIEDMEFIGAYILDSLQFSRCLLSGMENTAARVRADRLGTLE